MKQIAGIDTNRLKLLLVDDIPLNLILLDKMLKPYEFQIVKTNNGREALEQIQARHARGFRSGHCRHNDARDRRLSGSGVRA